MVIVIDRSMEVLRPLIPMWTFPHKQLNTNITATYPNQEINVFGTLTPIGSKAV